MELIEITKEEFDNKDFPIVSQYDTSEGTTYYKEVY